MVLVSNLGPGAGPLIVARAFYTGVYRDHTSIGRQARGWVRRVGRAGIGDRVHVRGPVIPENARTLIGRRARGYDVVEQRATVSPESSGPR